MKRKVVIQGKEFSVEEWGGGWWDSVEKGSWEPRTYNLFDRFLTSETNYIDVGAWIGPTVLYAATLAKHCWAIEPDPVAYKMLCENIAANHLNIETFNKAIYNREGTITLGSAALGDSMTRISHSGNAFQVPCQTLQSFVDQNDISDPLFVKMDVEGAEEYILEESGFFANRKPIFYLSLHPFWFKDKKRAMETVGKIGKLYKYHYVLNIEENQQGFGVVFSDEAVWEGAPELMAP